LFNFASIKGVGADEPKKPKKQQCGQNTFVTGMRFPDEAGVPAAVGIVSRRLSSVAEFPWLYRQQRERLR